ncbi:beta family protein [Pseudomonas sp. F3-2]|uniref:beta family protein n=1 Tax=Pseudomonas sp. F3-2 TaxID=3141539 RepID=UPI00315DFF38
MNQHYYPVVRAKGGEFDAFKHMPSSVTNRCTPILEIPKISQKEYETAAKHSGMPYEYWMDNKAKNIAAIFKGGSLIVDASQWQVDFTTESGHHVLGYMSSLLASLGVLVHPVVGYARWDSPEYRQSIRDMSLQPNANFVIRLDEIALEDMAEFDHFESILDDICTSIDIERSDTKVIIDIGDVTKLPILEITETITESYFSLVGIGFNEIVVTASSIPDSIEKAVKDRDSSDTVVRKEMLAWKGFVSANPKANLSFGDYGVRNPRSSDIIAPDMNVKIRYTIENGFFIVRGHSVRGPNGYAQSQSLSRVIVDSKHYLGSNFSWGDARILTCSQGLMVGNSTSWIAIDTNHHVTAVTTEIFEFATTVAAQISNSNITF